MASRRNVDRLLEGQQSRILKALSEWISATPGRRVSVTFDAEGYHVDLHDTRRTGGVSLVDSLAQATQIIIADGAE